MGVASSAHAQVSQPSISPQYASTGHTPPPLPPQGPLVPVMPPTSGPQCVDSGYSPCGGTCVDQSLDVNHCGGCGITCGSGQTCVTGVCTTSWDIGFGLEAELDLGYNTLVTGDATPYTDTLSVCEANNCGSRPLLPTPPFGGGVYASGALALRWSKVALGIRGSYVGYQADANAYMEDALFEGAAFDLHLRFILGDINISGTHMHLFLEPAVLYRRFNAILGREATLRTLGWDLVGGHLRVGAEVAVIDRLQVGAYVGAEALVGLGLGADGASGRYSVNSYSGEPEASVEFGLSVRYTLAFNVRTPTPPPPRSPPPPRPPEAFVLLQSRSVMDEAAQRADVTETDIYTSNRASFTTVAVLAPDACANESLSQATGQGVGSGEILRTQCGVEMAELERALTRAGYQVISWRTMSRMAPGMLPRDHARELGAQVLFQVNSLERSRNMPYFRRLERQRRFLMSNAHGDVGQPVSLLEPDAALMDQVMSAAEERTTASERPGVGIDITAVDVRTGQTIWLYQARKPLIGGDSDGVQVLMRGQGQVIADPRGGFMIRPPTAGHPTWDWRPVQPESDAPTPRVPSAMTARSGSNATTTAQSGHDNPVLFRLLRCAVSETVQRFRCGEAGEEAVCSSLAAEACAEVGGAQ